MPTSNRSDFRRCSRSADVTDRTAVYGPACPVVWEGSSRKATPYAECAEHVRQLEGESPFHNLMEVK